MVSNLLPWDYDMLSVLWVFAALPLVAFSADKAWAGDSEQALQPEPNSGETLGKSEPNGDPAPVDANTPVQTPIKRLLAAARERERRRFIQVSLDNGFGRMPEVESEIIHQYPPLEQGSGGYDSLNWDYEAPWAFPGFRIQYGQRLSKGAEPPFGWEAGAFSTFEPAGGNDQKNGYMGLLGGFYIEPFQYIRAEMQAELGTHRMNFAANCIAATSGLVCSRSSGIGYGYGQSNSEIVTAGKTSAFFPFFGARVGIDLRPGPASRISLGIWGAARHDFSWPMPVVFEVCAPTTYTECWTEERLFRFSNVGVMAGLRMGIEI